MKAYQSRSCRGCSAALHRSTENHSYCSNSSDFRSCWPQMLQLNDPSWRSRCTCPLRQPWSSSTVQHHTWVTPLTVHNLAANWTCYSIIRHQWLKYHRMQGNAVPAPPFIEIQRYHTFVKFNKNAWGSTTSCCRAKCWCTVPSPLIFHFNHHCQTLCDKTISVSS